MPTGCLHDAYMMPTAWLQRGYRQATEMATEMATERRQERNVVASDHIHPIGHPRVRVFPKSKKKTKVAAEWMRFFHAIRV